MRRILASALLVMSASLVVGQGAKVLNAYNYMNDGELIKAMQEIEPATENEKTKIDGKTWYYRGLIYEQIFYSEDAKYDAYKEGSLMKAIESYKQAQALGSKRINMNDVADRYQRLGAYAYQEGVNQFNNKNFKEAHAYFETCYTVRQENNIVDSGAIYSAGVSAMNAEMNDEAIKDFKRTIEIGYNVEDSYINISKIYKKLGNAEMYKATLAEARQALPQSQDIITAEINIYLEAKEYDKALNNLNLAVENDPNNYLLWFVKGNIYDTKQAALMSEDKMDEATEFFEKAKADYTKALSIKEDYFDAAYSLGALYYNRGAELLNKANMISDDAAYKKAKTAAEAVLKDALPFLERAHELQPDDLSTMNSLKELYARTNQMEKYKAMSEKLSN